MRKQKRLGVSFYFLFCVFIGCIILTIYLLFVREFFIAGCMAFLILILWLVLNEEKKHNIYISGGTIKKTNLDYKIDKIGVYLLEEGFCVRLFMSVIGCIFISFAFVTIFINIQKNVQNNNIKNKGIPVTATITFASIISSDDTYYTPFRRGSRNGDLTRTYWIEYTVNGKKYTYSCESTLKFYNEGNTITIYCLLDNPNKVFVPLENGVGRLQIIIICPICIIIGGIFIKKYNVLKKNNRTKKWKE